MALRSGFYKSLLYASGRLDGCFAKEKEQPEADAEVAEPKQRKQRAKSVATNSLSDSIWSHITSCRCYVGGSWENLNPHRKLDIIFFLFAFSGFVIAAAIISSPASG
jgi:hypothetical protein